MHVAMDNLTHKTIERKALDVLEKYLANAGKAIGVAQVSPKQCIAVCTEQFKNKKFGVVRQFLHNRPDSEPTFTKKGLNATKDEWIRILGVLESFRIQHVAGTDFSEMLRLPVEGSKSAIQVYYHEIGEYKRIVMGRIYDSTTFKGKCGGASIDVAELENIIEYIKSLIDELSVNSISDEHAGITKTTGKTEPHDDFSNLF